MSTPRFATFVAAAGGSRPRAEALYEWNARLSAAFMHDLCHLEIGLRNACDRALLPAAATGDEHWTSPDCLRHLFPVTNPTASSDAVHRDANRVPRLNVARAREAAAACGRPSPLPGKVVAELMFGFWTYLFADVHEKTIWVPYLHRAFPPGTDRQRLNATLASLRVFRNRVAHHEPILFGSELHRRRLVSVVRMLSPDARAHLDANSDVAALLARRP